MDDLSTADGTWYLSIGPSAADLRKNNELHKAAIEPEYRCTLYVSKRAGLLITGRGAHNTVDNISFEPQSRQFQFQRFGPSFWEWHRGTITHGVYVGRFSHDRNQDQKPDDITRYQGFASGWNSTYLDTDIVPRVYEVLIDDRSHGRLRIDRAAPGSGQFTGRLRICRGPHGEDFEYDIEILEWDGTNLLFVKHGDTPATFDTVTESYQAVASGRMLVGTKISATAKPRTSFWKGARAEVLGHGLTPKTAAELSAWQEQTRAQLELLIMAGNPAPLADPAPEVHGPKKPIPIGPCARPASRDDDPNDPKAWHKYTRTRLEFSLDLPNAYGTGPIKRGFEAYLAMPFGEPQHPPKAKFPAVLALNGHHGSAWTCLHPGSVYHWYGDGFVQRGYVVLAVNVGHRNSSEFYENNDDYAQPGADIGFYEFLGCQDDLNGDGPGNPPQSPIQAPGMGSSDWADDGERAWNVLQAFQWLYEQPYIDQNCIFVTGLSLGGRIAAYVGALEPRLRGVVAACCTPDTGVEQAGRSADGHCCQFWDRADMREYIDTSDVLSLIAPRMLVVETGVQDRTYSTFKARPPLTPKTSVSAYFVGDKLVARRTRAAYAGAPAAFVHYLHYDVHRYHVGVTAPKGVGGAVAFVHTPVAIGPPAAQPWSVDWQFDPQTASTDKVLFDYLGCAASGPIDPPS
jgi:dienelactone hydrolase